MTRMLRLLPGIVAACVLALAPTSARAGVVAQAQPGYSSSTTDTTDETGHESHTETETWTQRYRLSLDRSLFPLLSVSAGGLLDWNQGTSTTDSGVSEFDDRRWNGFARLRLGTQALGGAVDYQRRQDSGESTLNGVTLRAPGVIGQTMSASLFWRPADLPTLDLRLSRSDQHDRARQDRDTTLDEALVASRYQPVEQVDLSYSLRHATSTDHLRDVRTTDLVNSLAATWTDSFREGRVTSYVSYTASARSSETTTGGGAGEVERQQIASGGLSVVEVFPATPTLVTLNPNAALVDGVTSASAGLNLVHSGGGLRPYRDVGGQFADVVTEVNAVYVYVDRTLPPELADDFLWEAYRSDDNLNWTRVATVGTTFDPFQNRFEIRIDRTQARYVKVVTQPIASTDVTDPRFTEILITELQFFLVLPAADVRGRRSDLAGNLSATTKVILLKEPSLTYDFSAFVTHASGRSDPGWTVVNGLSLLRRLTRKLGLTGRVDRSDGDLGRGHEATNRWSAGLNAELLPTLAGAATYSGQYSQLVDASTFSNTFGVSSRADLYEGIAVSAAGTYTLASDDKGRSSRGATASASASLVPNRVLSLTASGSLSDTQQSGGGQPELSETKGLVEASAGLTPFPALAFSATVTRIFSSLTESITLASFSGTVSPFPGGDLQLRYAYTESLDTSTDLRSRSHGPALRWNIRRGWTLDGAYSLLDSRSASQDASSRMLTATLLITLP